MRDTLKMMLALLLALAVAGAGMALADEAPSGGSVDDVLGMLGDLSGDDGQEAAGPAGGGVGSIMDMLDDLTGGGEPAPDEQPTEVHAEQPAEQPAEAPAEQPTEVPAEQPAEQPAEAPAGGYDSYDLLEGYLPATLNDTVLVQVPAGWGNNAGDNPLTSYSPVNGSGAISPNAGTISTNWFKAPGDDRNAVLADYAQRIGSKKVVSGLQASPVTVDGQPGSLLTYGMDVGANHFDVNVLCFAYQDNIYAVDLTQGSRSQTDYRPVFDAVSGSLAIYDDSWDIDALRRRAEEATQSEPEPQPAPQPETQPAPQPETQPVPQPETQPEPQPETPTQGNGQAAGDLGDFAYTINGNRYSFPTLVADMAEADLPIDRADTLPYDMSPAAADNGGVENPLVNTQFYAYDDPASMELVGVTNLTGMPAPLTSGVVTALVDTQSAEIALTLAGGVTVGSPESAVIGAFPEFSGRALDGLAGFRGNELLYACNVRSDGSHGYALIRNDAPYYSTLTVICSGGVVTEINFECLGEALATGIFL